MDAGFSQTEMSEPINSTGLSGESRELSFPG